VSVGGGDVGDVWKWNVGSSRAREIADVEESEVGGVAGAEDRNGVKEVRQQFVTALTALRTWGGRLSAAAAAVAAPPPTDTCAAAACRVFRLLLPHRWVGLHVGSEPDAATAPATAR
jgi:hypothetical protein